MKVPFPLKAATQTVIIVASIFTTQNVAAQGTRSDYQRALNLRKNTANKVFKQRVNPQAIRSFGIKTTCLIRHLSLF